MQPELDLSDALAGRCTIGQTLLDGPSGVKVLPGASGNRGMAELTTSEMTRVIQAIDGLTPAPDYMLIDTGAGIGTQVISGYPVSFGPNDHSASHFVEMSMLTGDGRVRT